VELVEVFRSQAVDPMSACTGDEVLADGGLVFEPPGAAVLAMAGANGRRPVGARALPDAHDDLHQTG